MTNFRLDKLSTELHTFWRLVDEHNFLLIIKNLTTSGISHEDIPDVLFEYTKLAISEGRLDRAKSILFYLFEILEEQTTLSTVIEIIGNIYREEGEHALARKYFGQLPMTLNNIQRCLRTFLPDNDLEGLLDARDEIWNKLIGTEHEQMLHDLVDGLFDEIWAQKKIVQSHIAQLEVNLRYLQEIDSALLNDRNFQSKLEIKMRDFKTDGCVYRIGESLFTCKKSVWQRVVCDEKPLVDRKRLKYHTNVILRCNGIVAFVDLLKAIQTDDAEIVKYECYLVIDYLRLIDFLCVVDLKPILNCDFIFKFVDSQNIEASLKKIIFRQKSILPNEFVIIGRDDVRYCQQTVQPLLKEIKDQLIAQIEKFERQSALIYTADFPQIVAGKIECRQPLKVLFRTTRYSTFIQHSTRDMAEGFKELGHEVYIMMESEKNGVGSRFDLLLKLICEFQPDIIFSIDHLRYECPWIPKSIPYVTWVQDPVDNIFGISDSTLVTCNDFVYSCFKGTHCGTDRLRSNPSFDSGHVDLLPIGFDPRIYHPLDVDYKYDVSFVGHFNLPHEYCEVFTDKTDDLLSLKQLFVRNIFMFLEEKTLASHCDIFLNDWNRQEFWGEFIASFVKKYSLCVQEIPDHFPGLFFNLCLPAMFKSRILKVLVRAGIDVALFGNGWDRHPWFEKIALGPINNGSELNKVYNESRISLNLNEGTTLHPKFFEVVGGGNFCLSFYYPDDGLFLDNKDEIVVRFGSENDLVDKVKYYLLNADERQAKADQLRNEMLNNFTYVGGVRKIIKDFAINYQ